jgi:hypothetical protein
VARTFREALLARVAPDLTLKAIAEGAGVSYEQLKKLNQRIDAKTNYEDAMKVSAYFGLTLNEFLEDSLAQDRAALAATYSQLSPAERALLRVIERGRVESDPAAGEK